MYETSQQPTPSPVSATTADDEISLIDILVFLRRHVRLIGGLTLIAALLGVGSALLQTPQVRRQIELQAEPVPDLVATLQISADELALTPQLYDALAPTFEQQIKQQLANQSSPVPTGVSLEFVQATAQSGTSTNRLQLTLTASDASHLGAAQAAALTTLETTADQLVRDHIASKIRALAILAERSQAKIAYLQEQQQQLAAPTGAETSLLAMLQVQSWQAVLAQEASALATYSIDQQALTDWQSTSQPLVTLEVRSETEPQRAPATVQQGVLAAIAGFMLSILVAIAIEQIGRLRQALAAADQSTPDR